MTPIVFCCSPPSHTMTLSLRAAIPCGSSRSSHAMTLSLRAAIPCGSTRSESVHPSTHPHIARIGYHRISGSASPDQHLRIRISESASPDPHHLQIHGGRIAHSLLTDHPTFTLAHTPVRLLPTAAVHNPAHMLIPRSPLPRIPTTGSHASHQDAHITNACSKLAPGAHQDRTRSASGSHQDRIRIAPGSHQGPNASHQDPNAYPIKIPQIYQDLPTPSHTQPPISPPKPTPHPGPSHAMDPTTHPGPSNPMDPTARLHHPIQ